MAAPPRGLPTSGPGKIPNGYTPDQGERLTQSSRHPSRIELCYALEFMAELIQAKGISYAVMGGLALNLRGSRRETHDVDIVVACNMLTLRQACIGVERIKVPIGPTSGVMRVFLEVGQKWIQVDLILAGSLGAPYNLSTTTESVTLPKSAGAKLCTAINIRCQFQSKLGSLLARNSTADYLDLEFMCNQFSPQIAIFRDQLSLPQRENFVIHCAANIEEPDKAARIEKMKRLLGVS
ncbi:hypothetical protein PG996_015442 [Apiospora saccharicola]|uniref:Uncharacterized protein n=1 Tax=Apiospora saccharicola TaxID=335842 RepID=A0ABR1TL82_9PEZI